MKLKPTAPLAGQPHDADGPVFREAWEAQAFAMTLMLHEQSVFTWTEWAATLALEITAAQSAGDPDLGLTYYHHWLNALEHLVVEKGSEPSQYQGVPSLFNRKRFKRFILWFG